MTFKVRTIGGAPVLRTINGLIVGPLVQHDDPLPGRPVLSAQATEEGITLQITSILNADPAVSYQVAVIGAGSRAVLVPGDEAVTVQPSQLGFTALDTAGTLTPQIIGGKAGVPVALDLTVVIGPEPDVFAWGTQEPDLTATVWQVGGGLDYTPPDYTGAGLGATATNRMQARTPPATDGSDTASFFASIPDTLEGLQIRAGTTVSTDTQGSFTKWSEWSPTIAAAEVPDLTAAPITLSQIAWSDSYEKPTGTPSSFGGQLLITDPALAAAMSEFEVTTHPASFPTDDKFMRGVRVGTSDVWRFRMKVDAENVAPIGSVDPLANPRIDYSCAVASSNHRNNVRVRWKKAGGEWSLPSPVLPQWPEPTPTEVISAAKFWRPLHIRTTIHNTRAADFPANIADRPYGGEGLQMSQVFVRAGSRTWFGGDMCGLRFVENDNQWFNPRARGLHMCVFHAIGVDPSDPARVIVIGSCGQFRNESTVGNAEATYLSTDTAHTFERKSADQSFPQRQRIDTKTNTNPLAALAGGTPTTRKWRAFAFDNVASAKFGKSDDGGESWTWTNFSAFGGTGVEYWSVIPHPSTTNTWYVCTSAGLWRTTNDGGSFTRIGNGAGKLSGEVRALWIDPANPNKMLASQNTGTPGVFYTTNGGANAGDWTQVLNQTGGECSPAHMAVGPTWTSGGTTYRTIYVMNKGSAINHKDPVIQHWNVSGAPSTAKRGTFLLPPNTAAPFEQWFRPDTAEYSLENPHWQNICGGNNSTGFAPDPVDHNRVCVSGYGYPWFSTDGGASFRPGAGYGGVNSQAMSIAANGRAIFGTNDIPAMVMDTSDPNVINLGDLGSETGFSGKNYENIQAITGSTSVSSTAALAMPDGSRLIACGSYGGEQIILRRNPAATGWTIWKNTSGQRITTPARLYRMFLSVNTDFVFCGSARSVNAGLNWTPGFLNGRLCCGVSAQTAGIVYAKASGSTSVVQRSTDHGSSWSNWVTGLAMDDSGKFFWLSPDNHNRAISRSAATGDLCLIVDGDITLDLNLRGAYNPPAWSAGTYAKDVKVTRNGRQWTSRHAGNTATPSASTPADWLDEGPHVPLVVNNQVNSGLGNKLICSSVEWCPLDPRRITAFAKTFGRPQLWEGYFNSTFTAIVWRDITRNFPCTSNTRDMTVHPLTGERVASCGQGIWVLPVDYDDTPAFPGEPQQAGEWHNRLPVPFVSAALEAEYAA